MKLNGKDLFDLSKPYDHEALLRSITLLCEAYPFLQYNYLGNSVLGNGIPLLTLGNGKREILYVGAHHGMEWITSLLLIGFAKELCDFFLSSHTRFSHSPTFYFQAHTIHLIPMLNPDGINYQIHGIKEENPLYDRVLKMNESCGDLSHWQANARGVDLNHNYDADFGEYKQLEQELHIEGGAPTRFSGEHPESEPEVASLCNFIRFHQGLCGVMSLHTQGEEIFYGNDPHTKKIAQKLSLACGYKLSIAENTAAFGGLTDWCVKKRKLPAVTLECGRGKNPLPITDYGKIYDRLCKAFFIFPTLL